MAERFELRHFKDSLGNGTLPIDILDNFVQFDSKSPIPKLIFRPDAPLDEIDPEYDVDRAIWKYLRKRHDEKRIKVAKLQSTNLKSVVAEGDSWFNLPPFIGIPPAIATCIKNNGRFEMYNIAYWGHTLVEILKDKEYFKVMEKNTPDFFIFSAGGNDIRVGLKNYVKNYSKYWDYSDKDRRIEELTCIEHLNRAMSNIIGKIKEGYEDILDEVTKEFFEMKVFCHGYDYPRICPKKDENETIEDEIEDEDKVEYIGNHLSDLEIPYDEMDAILRPIVDELNKAIEDAVAEYKPRAKFINLRGVASIAEFDWIDDMHPGEEGFKALAVKFEKAMSEPELLV